MQQPQQVSSGSDCDPRYATMDERKRKRMISNRESARRSRMRKQQHMDELMKEANELKTQNSEMSMKIDAMSRLYIGVESENNVVRAQIMELTDRLRSLNSVLQFMQDTSGFAVDIPEIPDSLLEPWRLPTAVHTLSNAFQC